MVGENSLPEGLGEGARSFLVKARADEPLHAEEAKEKAPYINKYGFLHVDKKLAEHLGVEFGKDKADVPVKIELIEKGFTVKLA